MAKYIDELIKEAFFPVTDRERVLLDIINKLEAEVEEQDQAILNALKRMGEIREETARELGCKLKENAGWYPYYQYGLEQAVSVEKIDKIINSIAGESNG